MHIDISKMNSGINDPKTIIRYSTFDLYQGRIVRIENSESNSDLICGLSMRKYP